MDVDEDRTGKADDGGFVGEDADDTTATLELAVEVLERVGRPQLAPVRPWEGAEGEHLLFRSLHEDRCLGEARRSLGHVVPLGGDLFPLAWAKIVRKAAATISCWPLGTLAKRLRPKWTRQR